MAYNDNSAVRGVLTAGFMMVGKLSNPGPEGCVEKAPTASLPDRTGGAVVAISNYRYRILLL
jgi:hypothetical protein